MRVCFATAKTALHLIEPVRALGLDYITPEQILCDVANRRLVVCMQGRTVLGFFSLYPERSHDYTAIKRFVVFRRDGMAPLERGFIIKSLLDFAEEKTTGKIGATPFGGNPMERILINRGYKMQYRFDDDYCFYAKAV